MIDKIENRGGKRPGSGRPRIDPSGKREKRSIYVTNAEMAAVKTQIAALRAPQPASSDQAGHSIPGELGLVEHLTAQQAMIALSKLPSAQHVYVHIGDRGYYPLHELRVGAGYTEPTGIIIAEIKGEGRITEICVSCKQKPQKDGYLYCETCLAQGRWPRGTGCCGRCGSSECSGC